MKTLEQINKEIFEYDNQFEQEYDDIVAQQEELDRRSNSLKARYYEGKCKLLEQKVQILETAPIKKSFANEFADESPQQKAGVLFINKDQQQKRPLSLKDLN